MTKLSVNNPDDRTFDVAIKTDVNDKVKGQISSQTNIGNANKGTADPVSTGTTHNNKLLRRGSRKKKPPDILMYH